MMTINQREGRGGPMMIRPQKVIKVLNFAHLMNQQQERPHKKQYNHAEYFAPEQIEKSEE